VRNEPAFEVDIEDAPAEIEADQTLSVDAVVTNIGEADGTTTARLSFDGRTVDSETVSVDGDFDTDLSETVTLTKAVDERNHRRQCCGL